ncbi:hypothetical protein PIB30_079472 [Stylosanthes scabra]|uniref:Uncharacterized protein n=1 Tax=Stylosanthes scabra TaxID=79078 RepID=A0ABU6QRS2_9FABA|nr:hypothetical protein [Stylosanthes scabra]
MCCQDWFWNEYKGASTAKVDYENFTCQAPDPDDTTAKFGAEVAKKGVRNEKIAKKSLEDKSRAYAYAPKEPMHTHRHDLGVTSKLEPDHMRTHQRGLCVRTSGQICAYK